MEIWRREVVLRAGHFPPPPGLPRTTFSLWHGPKVPTERHQKFPAYQSGREFDEELLDQLDLLPEIVAACGFQNAKAPGYEADDFLAAAVAAEKRRHGTALVASGDRDTFQLPTSRRFSTPSGPARWLVSDPPRCATGTG
jgi:5'-3' exonuclease